MEFITAIYFTDNKKRKSVFINNPHGSCLSAAKYSDMLDVFAFIPKSAKDIRVRTHELGVVSHLLT